MHHKETYQSVKIIRFEDTYHDWHRHSSTDCWFLSFLYSRCFADSDSFLPWNIDRDSIKQINKQTCKSINFKLYLPDTPRKVEEGYGLRIEEKGKQRCGDAREEEKRRNVNWEVEKEIAEKGGESRGLEVENLGVYAERGTCGKHVSNCLRERDLCLYFYIRVNLLSKLLNFLFTVLFLIIFHISLNSYFSFLFILWINNSKLNIV